MINDAGLRIATANGAMLADPSALGNVVQTAGEAMFDPEYWAARGPLAAVGAGRGAAWFIAAGAERWVLRHYRRGGVAARLSADRYLWAGESRVRAFAEWRLLARLWEMGLPVPKPVAARFRRHGLTYRCDLITQQIPDTEPLSLRLAQAPLSETAWRAVGSAVGLLHRAGVDHADLNAHNILLDSSGAVSVIDFDRSTLRGRGQASRYNMARLRRSLEKISMILPRERFSPTAWRWLLDGHRAASE